MDLKYLEIVLLHYPGPKDSKKVYYVGVLKKFLDLRYFQDKIRTFFYLYQIRDMYPNSGNSIETKGAERPWLLVKINRDKGNKKYMAFYENIYAPCHPETSKGLPEAIELKGLPALGSSDKFRWP